MKTIRRLVPLSREGLLWFLAACAVLVTGLLKGINLITLLGCWMVVLVALNHWWAGPQLRHLSARSLFPDPIFAQTPGSIQIRVENRGTRPVFGIAASDKGQAHDVSRFLSSLAASATVNLSNPIEMPRRGRYFMEPLRLTSGYPLGLVRLTKAMAGGDELVVFPKLGALKRGALRRFLAQHSPTLGQARAFPRRHPGAQTEFHGLRPFRAGDSPRWIHWRTTARRGELMVREFEDMPNDHLVLIVDAGLPNDPLLERALSLAGTICWDWCRQKGDRLALGVLDVEPSVLVGTTSTETACAMLRRLALTLPTAESGFPSLRSALRAAELPAGPILVVTTRERGLRLLIEEWLHRSVAQLDLQRGEEKVFFE